MSTEGDPQTPSTAPMIVVNRPQTPSAIQSMYIENYPLTPSTAATITGNSPSKVPEISIEDPTKPETSSTASPAIPTASSALLWRSKIQIALCLLAFVVVVSLSISIGYTQRTPEFNSVTGDSPESDNGHRKVTLGTDLVLIDASVGTITFDWYIYQDSKCIWDYPLAPSNCTGLNPNSTVDIYFDPNLLSGEQSSKSDDFPDAPIFRHNATAQLEGGFSSPIFRTTLKLFTSSGKSRSSLQNYPFDEYLTQIYMAAYDSQTGDLVILTLRSAYGIAVGYKAVATYVTTTTDGFIGENIVVTRSGLVKAFVITIVIAVWLITLMFTFLTIRILCGLDFDIALLLVPVATLFTITQLRSSMPGAPPGFGAIIDFVGTLPCLAVTSIAATAIITTLIFKGTGDGFKRTPVPSELT